MNKRTYRSLVNRMWQNSKDRAERKGVPHSITRDDIFIPETCPVLGIPLRPRKGIQGPCSNSPTLDRFVPELGYVAGNVRVISSRANSLKGNATVEEVEAILAYMKEMIHD